MIPVDVLIRPITADDIFAKVVQTLESVNIPAGDWRDGGVAKTIVYSCCSYAADGVALVSSIVKGFFLAYAEGDFLSNHAEDVYSVIRIAATFATGQVTLTNSGGAVYTISANTLVVSASNTGARYMVTQDFVLPAATVSGSVVTPATLTVNVRAIASGASSSVAPAEIDTLETPLRGVTVANASSIIGRDAEGDDALRKRCLLKKGTWSPFGPRDAYEYAALSATLTDGTPTNITRVAISRYSSTGTVTVTCATPSGTPSSDELNAVRTNCEAIARPDSVTLIVQGAVQHATTHSITLWANGGASSTVLLANAQAALGAFYASYPIGGISKADGLPGYVYLDAIAAVVINSSADVFDVDFEAGATDDMLGSTEVAVNTTTITVRTR